VIGLLLCRLALAQGPPDAPPPETGGGAAFVPVAAAPVLSRFTSPVPLTPLVVAWPADEPAPGDAVPAVVELQLLVDESGAIEAITPVSGDAAFSAAAVAALTGARFTPATEDGVPVAVEVPLRVEIAPPPVNVDGVVRYAGAGDAPAVGVLVSVAGQSVRTDEAGRFAFRAVPDGAQVVRVLTAGPGLVADSPFTLVTGDAVHLELWARSPEVPAGVIGVYRRERDEVVRRTITAEELRTLPGTMGDPLRAIANLPGAVRTPLDAGWLLVRGGDPRDTGVYIDGARVPLIYHLGGFTSVINPAFVDRVDFYPGGQSARYGRATAGAVDLLTRPRPTKLEARAGANIVLASAYAAVPVGKLGALSAGVRRSYLDGVLGLIPGVTDEQAQIAPRFWDWQARADYGPASVLGLGYVDTIDASTSSGDAAQVSVETHRVHGSLRLEVLGKPLLLKPHYAYEHYRLQISVLDRDQQQERNGGGGRIELADDGEGRFGWSVGADTSFDWFGMELNEQQLYAHLDSPDVYADVRIGETIRTVIGVRLDTLFVSRQLPRAAPSPRVSVVVPIGDIVTLVGDAGLYHQPPPAEMLIGPPEGSSLELEQSYGGGGGVRLDYGPWQIGLDAYSRTISRITAYEEDGSLGQIEGQASGLEAMVRYSTTRLSGWLTYSYGSSQRREDADDAWYPSTYDQPHTLVAVATADLGKRWTLGGRWRYASGFPVATEDEIEAYDVLLQKSVVLEPDRFSRTEPFHGLDLKISKRAQYEHWRLEYYLDVQNVYNRRVAEPVISGVWEAYGTQTYGFGLPILPILGVEAVFGG
jgi:outer membrane receptor protein involved in Fe transport